MAKFDLTSKMTKYLDRHLVAPLLEFLWAKKVSVYQVFSCLLYIVAIKGFDGMQNIHRTFQFLFSLHVSFQIRFKSFC